MIDSAHGTMSFSRQKRDEDGVPIPKEGQTQRVILTGPVPPYILKQMQATEPKPLPESHPASNDHAKTVRYRTMVQVNGEWV